MNPRTVIVLLSLLGLAVVATAQKTRYNFAQSYVGIQGDYLASSGSSTPDFGALRLNLGGTHFWYRADFYLSIPLLSRSLGAGDTRYGEGIITGARYLPWGPGRKYPRPFVGVQWLTPSFRRPDGPTLHRSRLGLDAGLSLVLARRYTLEASVHHVFRPSARYPDSRTQTSALELPGLGFSVGMKRYFDFTAGNATPAGATYIDETTEKFREIGALSGWELAVGPSALFPLQAFAFTQDYAFLPSTVRGVLFPDFALGYYFHKPDIGLRLAYRPTRLGQAAYGLDWKLQEHRLGLEAFRFLFDYKGFVPFLGLGGGMAHSQLRLNDEEPLLRASGWRPDLYLVFGWDIRPSPIDWFILRTGLRYAPNLSSRLDGVNISGRNLEVNFIQFVFYPKRFKNK